MLDYTLDHEHQIPPCQAAIRRQLRGRSEGASLQHLGVKHQTAGLPVEKFDTGPRLVDEDIHVTVSGILSHAAVYDAAQCVEALSHVRGLAPKPVSHAVIQTEHDYRPCISS